MLVAALAAGLCVGGCATEEYVDQQVAATNARVDAALARAEEAHKLARGDFQHTVLMTNDQIKFASDASALSGAAMSTLASFAGTIRAENRNVHIEVIGHGDSTASSAHNLQLGQRRADAVVRFLHGQGIPLHHMSAVSYGEEQPKASNATPEGRAENRRVVLVVLG
jgi:outer membrane protein OmpA-like peptidoglycan-associated protein